MSNGDEVERYVNEPSLLVELCREVVDRLDTGSDNGETAAMEAQLREIARAIDNLDKLGVPVPDTLRAEKTRLAAALGISAESTQTLNHLADDLEDLLSDLKSRLGRVPVTTSVKKPRAKRSKAPKTENSVLRQLIIEALQHNGGSAQKTDVLQYMEQQLQGKLLPGDLVWRDSAKESAWKNNAAWERSAMKKAGILKSDSPLGIWELSEDRR